MMFPQFLIGFLLSMGSVVLWATAYIAFERLLQKGLIDPVSLSFIRFAGAGALMLVAGVIVAGRGFFNFSRRDLGLMIAQGTVGMGGMSVFLLWGQKTSGAINSSIIMSLTPVLTLGIAMLSGNAITRRQAIGVFLALTGSLAVLRVIGPDGIRFNRLAFGDLLVLAGALCWAVFTVWGRAEAGRIGGFRYTAIIMLGALPMLGAAWAFAPGPRMIPDVAYGWALIGYIILFPTCGAFFCWNQAQKMIPLSLLNIMQYLTPVTVLIFAGLLERQSIQWIQVAGAVLAVAGVLTDDSFAKKEVPR